MFTEEELRVIEFALDNEISTIKEMLADPNTEVTPEYLRVREELRVKVCTLNEKGQGW